MSGAGRFTPTTWVKALWFGKRWLRVLDLNLLSPSRPLRSPCISCQSSAVRRTLQHHSEHLLGHGDCPPRILTVQNTTLDSLGASQARVLTTSGGKVRAVCGSTSAHSPYLQVTRLLRLATIGCRVLDCPDVAVPHELELSSQYPVRQVDCPNRKPNPIGNRISMAFVPIKAPRS